MFGLQNNKTYQNFKKIVTKKQNKTNKTSDCLPNAIDLNRCQYDKIKYSGIKGVRSHFKLQDLFFGTNTKILTRFSKH